MNKEKLFSELKFKAIRSSGSGGQHVNKVSSKIELTFDLANTLALTPSEKERALEKLKPRLTKDHVLILQCDEAKSQHQNKKLVTQRFFTLLKKALHVPKKRKPTKPSKSSIEKRLKSKKKDSQKKANRRRPEV
ncbi:alternative ribosome rescue aminoacyl-tRNA hydrolase ArfB [Allomuricauda sp. SCSIO 65647]|uniref:alternative ribosome rescue aminoacyl-tRNA hydrolase ArfB n=1 Tax=Allomuricauda sp. SCSIO 65647 TaxID=2908843 RepID=UPI001F2D6F82|nr:alternative ribosome rescue aminoacyl-tRNA hydrolase ArfB [Muricauda sp. SCSIO 65647]UJH69185.1 aminoacyl-tRNA hydrolase [Muricauda sp. SCSIO 65647]